MKALLRFAAFTPQTRALDVGGSLWFWSESPLPCRITILNLRSEANPDPARYELVEGDALRLPYTDGSFDLAVSNSVIEHVGTWENQQRFAAEIRRVAGRLWVQTPARGFPVEPHLVTPVVHWLPRGVQRRLLRNFTVWGWLTRPGPAQVDAFLDEVRLLTYDEMRELFPDCAILRERVLGVTKSYIAVRPAPGREAAVAAHGARVGAQRSPSTQPAG
ncbi:MAG TPA: class I SAM-dependent methyltransferase [Longimicrobium sp.]|nr:class I SAM-dependent methyltransferase [Longimicrobium sp.]